MLLSERERLFVEQGGPRRKATLGFTYATGPVETDFKIFGLNGASYFGRLWVKF